MSENKKGKTMKNGFNSVYLCVIYSAVLIVFEHDLYMYDVPLLLIPLAGSMKRTSPLPPDGENHWLRYRIFTG